jgi:hypothetical protein
MNYTNWLRTREQPFMSLYRVYYLRKGKAIPVTGREGP